METIKKNHIIEDGKNVFSTLQQELGYNTVIPLIKKIEGIRTVEKGKVKRELTKEEFALKDFILRQGKTLRWTCDLLELTIMPSDLQYLVETNQMRIKEALKQFHKRRKPYSQSSSYAYIMKEIKSLMVVIEDEWKNS